MEDKSSSTLRAFTVFVDAEGNDKWIADGVFVDKPKLKTEVKPEGVKNLTKTTTELLLTNLQSSIHQANVTAGWWTDLSTNMDLSEEARQGTRLGKALVAEKLCLIHSEISEAMEGHRKNLPDDKLPHRLMLEVEMADAVIRIMDLAGAMKLDIGGAIQEKLSYNATREDHQIKNRKEANGKSY